jgi:hypothetical protein
VGDPPFLRATLQTLAAWIGTQAPATQEMLRVVVFSSFEPPHAELLHARALYAREHGWSWPLEQGHGAVGLTRQRSDFAAALRAATTIAVRRPRPGKRG